LDDEPKRVSYSVDYPNLAAARAGIFGEFIERNRACAEMEQLENDKTEGSSTPKIVSILLEDR
jgi:hypothetical protein